MFKAQAAFSGFSVNDLAKANDFYTGVLGLQVDDGDMGLKLHLPGGGTTFVYLKDNTLGLEFSYFFVNIINYKV